MYKTKKQTVDVPNSNSLSCCNSSLLECTPEFVGSNHGGDIYLSGGGGVKSLHIGDPDVQMPDIQGTSFHKCYSGKKLITYKPTFDLAFPVLAHV